VRKRKPAGQCRRRQRLALFQGLDQRTAVVNQPGPLRQRHQLAEQRRLRARVEVQLNAFAGQQPPEDRRVRLLGHRPLQVTDVLRVERVHLALQPVEHRRAVEAPLPADHHPRQDAAVSQALHLARIHADVSRQLGDAHVAVRHGQFL
jgi:hypothetical protein